MRRYAFAYTALVIVPVACAVLIFAYSGWAGRTSGASGAVAQSPVARFLIAAVIVVIAAAVCGWAAQRVGQPKVVGELVAGLLLGPSALGALAPGLESALFPKVVLPHLDMLAQLGVIFFMFLVGMQTGHERLRENGARGVVIGHASIAVPFLGGILVAWSLYDRYSPPRADELAFALFIGLSFAITAFPVLARILQERKLINSRIGTTALAAAGIGDVTAWCLLAVIVALVQQASTVPAVLSLAAILAFTVLMLAVVRPLLARLLVRADGTTPPLIVSFGVPVCVLLSSAVATDLMGLHALFGAFLAGAVMPRREALLSELSAKLESLTLILLLPLFFVTIGLKTDVGAVTGGGLLICVGLVAVAVATKFLGAGLAARAVGFGRSDSLAVGSMMNCRGLTELVVLNIGYQLGILNGPLFTMFVLMTVVTTAMTGPLLMLLVKPAAAEPPHVPAARPA
ncbi:cation:proton antiporter [Nocardia pseudobrasiliensis]|uniref:Kef-type K+ transport system membrane component KefB n=1 Tax=Nocardia pseudobrasiliensis TaxID=45979 RepID=A0A370IB70_9NOCA|nr:cation:proton antiporter [Nocardia pseudobrasiliensis]RDI67963.1 Kef-type K+ transport system membrane component KefB [Nocardia pseudobrasiliensis]